MKNLVSSTRKIQVTLAVFAVVGMGSAGATAVNVAGSQYNPSGNSTYDNTVATTFVDGPGSAAIGQANIIRSTTGSSSAYGNQNFVSGHDTNAFGDGNDAYAVVGAEGRTNAFGDDNFVYGTRSNSFGADNRVGTFNPIAHPTSDAEDKTPVQASNMSNAFGTGNIVTSREGGTALGFGNTVTADYAAAIGANSRADQDKALAIGTGAIAGNANSVALGSGSVTGAAINTNSATVGEITYSGFAGNTSDGTASIGSTGHTRQLQNVSAGQITANSTDAVNGSQLYQIAYVLGQNTANGAVINNRIRNLDSKVNRVGAGAAALAGLHPLDFNPDDKWSFTGGYGRYNHAHAYAVGAFYQPNEDTMVSIATTVGGGEDMINAGVSFKLGQKKTVSNSRVAMAREIAELNNRLKDMEDKYNNLVNMITPGSMDLNKAADFPDVPANHWAYEYIRTLAGNGYIEGYPDGEFKGDRSMTRYEFATMLYRALKNGAANTGTMRRLTDEFEPELQQIHLNHFRVDRVQGKDNNRHKIERVRVNSEDKKARDVYGSRI